MVFTLDNYVGPASCRRSRPSCRAGRCRSERTCWSPGHFGRQDELVSALIAEIATTGGRIVLIEDTHELQQAAPNLVALRTKDGAASLSDLVRSSPRLRPDRIPIGEVRGD